MATQPPVDFLETRDGKRLAVRAIRVDDIHREREFINGLSEEARYNRLMYAIREPSPTMLRQFTEIDHVNTMALVATESCQNTEQFAAVARYSRDDLGAAAEFAVVVADRWQGRGIGTQLTRRLFAYAEAHGIERIYGTIFASNQRMLELARRLGMKIESVPDDPTRVIASLALQPARGA